jgi:homocysteine S-methyltransferase
VSEFLNALGNGPVLLNQGSVFERMRRAHPEAFDPDIGHAALLYDEGAAQALSRVHREYMAIAMKARRPMMAMAGTWRANPERIARSRFSDKSVNADQIAFMRQVASSTREDFGGIAAPPIFVAGVLGPKGDAFRPEESLGFSEAAAFHAPQIQALAEAGVDCLIAVTQPSAEEARGLSSAMGATGIPHLVSFVVHDDGRLLDGTRLDAVIQEIDGLKTPPVGYMINCVHPQVFEDALLACAPGARSRVLGLKANTSRLRPRDIDGSEKLLTEDPEILAEHMARVQKRFQLKMVGGCCGTDTSHIQALAEHLGEAK